MLIQQKQAIFPIGEVGQSATGNVELNSVNMAHYNHAAFFIQFSSTLVATTSTMVLTVESATEDSGDTGDVTFHYSLGTASANSLSTAMTYAADATASTLSLTTPSTTYAGHVLLVQVDGDELRSTSTGKVYNWITVDMDNATAGTLAAWAILSEPRYAGASMPVAI